MGNFIQKSKTPHQINQIPIPAAPQGKNQTTLTISRPGDRYELEADRLADQVMRMSEPPPQGACPCGGGCPKCQNQQDGRKQINTKPAQTLDINEANSSEEKIISSPGLPLDSVTRAFFEPRFGYAFSKVRVHTDSVSAQSARNLNSFAYTFNNHIVFGHNRYRPNTSQGRKLLAHELTHIIQQEADASQLSKKIQRQVPSESFGELWGETLYEIGEQIRCLESLFDEMSRQTNWYLRTACRDGGYLTPMSRIRYIPEDRSDAFGHCWIGCQGAKTCGQDVTRFWGESYEDFREAMRYLTFGVWGHNSYEEDIFDQRHGRELARNNPEGDCSSLCYQAVVSSALRFHGHHTGDNPARPRLYNCSDI